MGADRHIENEWNKDKHIHALADERNELQLQRDRQKKRADAYAEVILEKARSITDCSCRYMDQETGTSERCPTHRLLAEHGDLTPELDPRGKGNPWK